LQNGIMRSGDRPAWRGARTMRSDQQDAGLCVFRQFRPDGLSATGMCFRLGAESDSPCFRHAEG